MGQNVCTFFTLLTKVVIHTQEKEKANQKPYVLI